MADVNQMRIFKVLSALLNYPSEELLDALPDIRAAIKQNEWLTLSHRASLLRLVDDLAVGDLYGLQERYILLFDRTRSLSLHLFEHVHGESRDRGQAMIDLLEMYTKEDLAFAAGELPDFLPAFLEYCSTLHRDAAVAALAQTAHILAALAERLKKRGSAYAAAFEALCGLAAVKPSQAEMNAVLTMPDIDPNDFVALDKVWEEEAVTFGPGQDGTGACGSDVLAAKLRHGRRAIPLEPSQQVESPAHNIRHQGGLP